MAKMRKGCCNIIGWIQISIQTGESWLTIDTFPMGPTVSANGVDSKWL